MSGTSYRDTRFRPDVRGFYERHNRDQSLARARERAEHWAQRRIGRATVWERFSELANVRDASDGDLQGMSQLGHALQTANAIREAGRSEDWIVLGLVHDLGKLIQQHGERPEFVVGDIFPLGCAFSPKIRHAELLERNPDAGDPRYATRLGIYDEGCGLEQVTFAFGHDQYLYEILRDRVPREIAWTIRHHSFQSIAGEYLFLFDESDRALRQSHMIPFAAYDLYTKDPDQVCDEALDEYRELLERWFPEPLDW
ncbi:MAG: inositol oxygenase family protein [Myxococcota bacterium]